MSSSAIPLSSGRFNAVSSVHRFYKSVCSVANVSIDLGGCVATQKAS